MRKLIISLSLLGMAALPVRAQISTQNFKAEAGPEAAVSIYSLSEAGDLSASEHSLTHSTPVRIASVTKTFVAATALRLMEEGKLDITKSIDHYMDERFTDLLLSDGYNPSAITVRHLLTHTGGLVDHAQTQTFFDQLLKDPTHHWSREEQVKGAVEWADPLGRPGEKFAYSDTGYVLIGHIIEKQSGLKLAVAVRQYLKLDALGLKDTYWELVEKNSAAEARRAHQYFQGMDTHSWSATLDHYGGGGLVSTTQDMALFFKALFEDGVFKRESTLDLMLSKDGIPADSPYRIGIFVRDIDGIKAYEHSGFWGTVVFYVPSQGRAISGAVLHQKHYKAMRAALEREIANGR